MSSAPEAPSNARCELGQEIQLSADDLKNAGRYTVVIGDDSAIVLRYRRSGQIDRIPGPPFARARRDTPNVISGTAFLFDKYQNLVLQPQPVKFDLERKWADRQPQRDLEGRSRVHQAGFVEEGGPGPVRCLQR